ncbi:DUF3885 domain-containing protein [Hymenobacter aquaticus]|uniref:DUF3885 domain-containing protein n=1 Tax=Hymenobacter aquaticus TaxID=1867101 RepID=A0A4Z0Q653_9BACT|nr:DUF3885 domain-containing protein [Hymenobacter aquaticus]TGE25567.1 DUF3885 domain-containing protein [Hymenobacter aquaticus]
MAYPSTAFLQQNFPGLQRLCAGLFYRWPIGIRFDLQGEHPIYLDANHHSYDERYFQEVIQRASDLFKAAFQPTDEVLVIYQKPTAKRQRIRNTEYLLRQLGIAASAIAFQRIDSHYLYGNYGSSWIRMYHATTAAAIPYPKLATAIANQDFGHRTPRTDGDVFFLNLSRDLIFHMYDDRGLDIVAADKSILRPLFETYNSWIMTFDREQVEATFSEV